MQLIDGAPVYSATDLVGFLACSHLSELERSALAGLVDKPIRNDPELDLIAERGKQHERVYIERLRSAGREIVDVSAERAKGADRGDFYRQLAGDTRAAIERGDDVVFQACFFDGTWLGFADFLLRIDDPGAPLGWSYEIADTKLAHKVKASALLQICVYNEMLASIQGRYPEHMYVALGGKDRETAQYRTADFRAYFRSVRSRFLDAVGAPLPATYPPPPPSYPEPTEHCAVCSWDEICSKRRRADDHLSLVANITSRTRGALVDRDIETRRALATLPLPLEPRLEGTRPEVLERVREQARIQVAGRGPGSPHPRAAGATPHRRTASSTRPRACWRCRSQAPPTSTWTWRAIPSRARTAWITSSACCSRRSAMPTASPASTPSGAVTPRVA